uniref:Uncharacterized protein n=1 Tax=Cacopsylla melanoneura TaxID=428564 RepID=A0A8D8Y3P2_9HEMI
MSSFIFFFASFRSSQNSIFCNGVLSLILNSSSRLVIIDLVPSESFVLNILLFSLASLFSFITACFIAFSRSSYSSCTVLSVLLLFLVISFNLLSSIIRYWQYFSVEVLIFIVLSL